MTLWNEHTPHPNWCGLRLLGVDVVVWRTPDSPDNQRKFARTSNKFYESNYPQIRMACLMELSSHLLTAATFDIIEKNEMLLAADLIEKTPNNSLTLFDKGFYSLGLLHKWQTTGSEWHWLLKLKKGTQYRVLEKLGKGHEIIELTTSFQARKKWEGLPETLKARLLTR